MADLENKVRGCDGRKRAKYSVTNHRLKEAVEERTVQRMYSKEERLMKQGKVISDKWKCPEKGG